MIEALRESIPHSRAIMPVSELPASIICITDIGTGGCQCQPHQPNGSSMSSIEISSQNVYRAIPRRVLNYTLYFFFKTEREGESWGTAPKPPAGRPLHPFTAQLPRALALSATVP